MRPGISHHDVKKAIGPKLQAAAAVVLGHAHDFQNSARWLARVAVKLSVKLLLDDESGDFALFEDLIEEVVFAVLGKFGMKRYVEQSIRPTLAKHLVSKIGEQRFLLLVRVFLHLPNH